MKHPAFVRALAVFLAVMAFISAGAGAVNIIKAIDEKKEDERRYDLLASRTEEYSELAEYLDSSENLAELEERYEKLEKKHEKDRTAHRMLLGAYSANKSGMKQMRTAIASYIPNLRPEEVSDELLESLSGSIPLAVALYPELQDYVNNARAELDEIVRSVDADAIDTDELRKHKEEIAGAIVAGEMTLAGSAMPTDPMEQKTMVDNARSAVDSTIDEIDSVQRKISDVQTKTKAFGEQAVDMIDGLDGTVGMLDQMSPTLSGMIKTNKNTATDLINSKVELDREKSELDALSSRIDELRTADRRKTSLKVLLMTNENIKEAMKKSSDLISVSQKECARFEKEYKKVFFLKTAMSVLLILAGAAAVAGIPAAFERTKSRTWLILPVVLFTVLSLAAEGLCEIAAEKRQYAAIGCAIAGIIQLIAVLPRNREHFER